MSAGLPRTQVVMLAGVFGISLGLFAIYVDFGSWDQPTRDFASSGAFLFWVALLSAQTMLWTVALAPLLTTFRRHWRAREPQSLRREVIPSAVILASFVAALVILPRAGGKLPEIIPHHHLKIDILTAVALVVALVAATSIWLIRGRAEALGRKKTFAKNDLNSYLGLRSDLDGLLAFLGAVIGLAVLASAALRHLSLLYDETIDFPAESVVLYGLVLSLLVAFIYLPTFLTVQRAGEHIRNSVQDLPAPDDTELDSKLARRKTLDELLGLQVSASGSFRVGVAILSPLLGALTSLLPKLGS